MEVSVIPKIVGGTPGTEDWRAFPTLSRFCNAALVGAPQRLAPLLPQLSLAPIAPNPAAGPTTVHFTLPRAQRVRIDVIDVMGRETAMLVDSPLAPGEHKVIWNVQSPRLRVTPGIYFVRMQVDKQALVRRVAVVR